MQTWKEQDHPRDDDGKFTEKEGTAGAIDPRKITYRQNTPYQKILADDRAREKQEKAVLNIPLDFFGLSEDRYADWSQMPLEAVAFDGKMRRDTEHHQRHAKDMGFKSMKEYEANAREFWKNGKGTRYITAKNPRFYKYNAETEKFISVGTDGTIYTYMYLAKKKFLDKKTYERLKSENDR